MGAAAVRLGMRHIGWVTVVVEDDACRAEVHGVGHRLPRRVPVPLATASALVADGVPLVLRRRERRDAMGTEGR